MLFKVGNNDKNLLYMTDKPDDKIINVYRFDILVVFLRIKDKMEFLF